MDVILTMFGFTKRLKIDAKEPPPFIKTKLQNTTPIVGNFVIRCDRDGSTIYPERMNVCFELQGYVSGVPYYIADFSFDIDSEKGELNVVYN
jgi:hypothetical protein